MFINIRDGALFTRMTGSGKNRTGTVIHNTKCAEDLILQKKLFHA